MFLSCPSQEAYVGKQKSLLLFEVGNERTCLRYRSCAPRLWAEKVKGLHRKSRRELPLKIQGLLEATFIKAL